MAYMCVVWELHCTLQRVVHICCKVPSVDTQAILFTNSSVCSGHENQELNAVEDVFSPTSSEATICWQGDPWLMRLLKGSGFMTFLCFLQMTGCDLQLFLKQFAAECEASGMRIRSHIQGDNNRLNSQCNLFIFPTPISLSVQKYKLCCYTSTIESIKVQWLLHVPKSFQSDQL